MSHEELPKLSDSAQALINHELRRPAPAAEDQAQVLARLSTTLSLPPADALPSLPDTAGASGAATAGAAVASKLLPMVIASFLAGAGAGAGAFALLKEDAPARVEFVEVKVPVEKIVEVKVPVPAPQLDPPKEQKRPAKQAVTQTVKDASREERASEIPKVPPESTLEAERTLLDRARTALARGKPEDARAPLDRHAQEFPEGQLREEREVLYIQLLVSARMFDEARERAQRFRADHPRSILLPTVDAVLEQIP